MKIIATIFVYFNIVLLPIFRRFKALTYKPDDQHEIKKIVQYAADKSPLRTYPSPPGHPGDPPFLRPGCNVHVT